MKRYHAVLIAVSGCLLLATPALALDMEYYTYGGFNPIVQAFTKIALIFSDVSYEGLIFITTVLGIIAATYSYVGKAAIGMRIVPLTYLVPILFGAVVYLAAFVPKGTITVYDPTLNRFQAVGDVPDAVVLIAGFLNKIEKGLVDIIETAAAPDSEFTTTAGGIGFKTLESVVGSSPKDNYLRVSMIRYIKDCVTFELLRPGTTLSLDDLRNTSTDFLTELSQAVNPSVYTVYYDASAPEGTAMNCTGAWSRLQPIYANPANYDEALKKVCSKAHFNPAEATEMDTCKTLLSSTLNFTTGTAVAPEKIIQQRQIAEILYNFYFKDDYETSALMEANRKVTATGLGIGLTMNEWIPIIKAIMTAVAISMVPFLVIFLPTPIFTKAVSVMFGFFVFLSTWGVADAVIHGAAMDYASYMFEDMRQSSLGVYAIASFPNLSLKMLSMFGVIRSAGIMLASIFAMMLISFGGSALAHLATNLMGIARNAGTQAGHLLTPEGNAASMNEQIRTAGLLEGMQEHRFTTMAAANAFSVSGINRQVGNYVAAMNTRQALEKSGQIPIGTSDADMARMMAGAKVSVGANAGPVDVSTGPNGSSTQMQSSSVNSDGSVTTMTTGAGGTGVAEDRLAAGSASYAVDGSGGRDLTRASVNGLNPVTVGAMAQHQSVVSASKSLGSGTNWNLAYDHLQKDSLTSSQAQSYSEKLDNALKEGWTRSFNDKSSFVHTMDETTRTQFMGAVGAGWAKGIQLGGNGQIAVTGNDNEKVSFSVDESTSKAFARDQARVRSEALQQTFSSSSGLDYMTRMAKQIGASEAYSYLNDARSIRGATESYGADLTTALVRNYATERYGSDSPENIRRTIGDFNHFLTQQGSQGVSNMQSIISGFVSGGGYGWGPTASDVQSSIGATKARIGGQDIMRAAVNQATSTAAGRTSGIGPDGFSSSHDGGPLQPPDANGVSRDAEHLREVNRREERGEGRIQTTVGGMAKETVGNGLPGLVDSQGDRPTGENYFQELPSVPAGVNLPEPGPVPDGSISVLGDLRKK